MKMKIKIREACENKGIKNAYQLQKKANLAPSTAARLYRNEVTQITMETLEKILTTLDCSAGEIFVRNGSPASKEC
jgi:DNA-binding Xre family transcriptional regulator